MSVYRRVPRIKNPHQLFSSRGGGQRLMLVPRPRIELGTRGFSVRSWVLQTSQFFRITILGNWLFCACIVLGNVGEFLDLCDFLGTILGTELLLPHFLADCPKLEFYFSNYDLKYLPFHTWFKHNSD